MARTASLPARKHLGKLLEASDWKIPRIADEVGVSADVIRSLVAETGWPQTVDTEVQHAILALPIPDLPTRTDIHWPKRARCRGEDTERWFPLGPAHIDQEAIKLCKACPVRAECARLAKDTGSVGIFAGYVLPTERRALRRYVRRLDGHTAEETEITEPPRRRCGTCGCETYDRHDLTQTDAPGVRGYGGNGKCKPCYERERRAALAPPPGDPRRVAEHIVALRRSGRLLSDIAADAGCSVRTLQSALAGESAVMRDGTANAILAVEVREAVAV